ncbi:DUF421 domain-containing protein [Nodosilinea sp. PGN35]|uniref:DUF421 domain-containing protein n=1 Tax=Nodosilinea sp. PGN35 TaxID=3020489 RepID=UPI0023B31643|nr:YetF domain-containing protein [Nodosilinea sp. TSF1-S3]MDF0367290.1 DUF421 domain-containing protein [Nodosilinea sp. TSF1-S3]
MICEFASSHHPLVHTLAIGSLSYLALIVLLRLSGKRTLSKWNAFDFVVTVALGSILATVLLSTDVPLAQGVVGLGLLIGWQFVLTWLSVRSRPFQQWIKGHPTLLLWQGELRKDALRRERITEGEVRAAVRSKGGADLEQVAAIVLETDGTFSVIMQTSSGRSASALADVQGL